LDTVDDKANTVLQVIERYKNTVFRIAFAYCKNRSDADDIFQEVILRYLKARPEFNSEEHEKAWFVRVTVNCCKKHFFSSWNRKTMPIDEDIRFETAEQSDLFYAVMDLPLKYRIVIHLYYYEGYKIKQIAEMTKQKETTVATQLQRARQLLKTRLKEELIYG